MAYKRVNKIEIENARIMGRNFKGVETRYNKEGNRNFCVIIEDERLAQQMADDGWNIKVRTPRNEGEQPYHYISVAVNFNFHRPPTIVMISGRTRTAITEDMVGCLDSAMIKSCDLTIRPRIWNEEGDVKAYLEEMYVVVEQSRWQQKYAEEEYPCEDETPIY